MVETSNDGAAVGSIAYNFAPDFEIRGFDISLDGRESCPERLHERSDVPPPDLWQPTGLNAIDILLP